MGHERPHHTLFQTSTIETLLGGNYDGDVSLEELSESGDFGIGTLDALDGAFYQVRADGRAYPVDGRTRTTFAVVTCFEPGPPKRLEGPLDLAGLCSLVDGLVGETDGCCAVRVDGRCERVRTRSVPRQRRSYPPIVEVVEGQPTFGLAGVSGSLVGFRFPGYAVGLNVPGYPFHFITDDRGAGGRVLALQLVGGELHVDREADLQLELPPEVSLPVPGQASSDAVNRVERER